ncbi:hypothetical protein BM221_008344 [Beauveria bassiana]|uniref:Uncharacterized protein n=1 Tax=Beauveria bassiana TaxID=176275 RepID=A0A2N6NFV7_BEABA|nr:hypothetical protein BM221_008344 [Beauveria bassiana]
MSGAPGSGKSTVARLLGRAITTVVIDHDVLRSAFLKARLPFDQAAKGAYDLQWALAPGRHEAEPQRHHRQHLQFPGGPRPRSRLRQLAQLRLLICSTNAYALEIPWRASVPALINHPLPRPPREKLEYSSMLVGRAETKMAALSSVTGFNILAAHKTML